MRIRRLRTIVGMLSWIMALSLAGCHSAQQPASADVKAAAERADVADEARGVAEAALGKQAEILARGNLALNGREKLLFENGVSKRQ
jgi:lipoprotein NlpI